METQFGESADGSFFLSDSLEAVSVKSENEESPLWHPLSPDQVAESTRMADVQQRSCVSDLCLPAAWIPVLPPLDQQWISRALFKWSQTGQPELDFAIVDKNWWYPPQPSPVPTAIPEMVRYFGHPFFIWMPMKVWHVQLFCPHKDCGKELSFVGLHQQIRRVVGLSRTYFMATEDLSCRGCSRAVASWSHSIVHQLDICHQVQFPCLLSSELGCDRQVVRQLRFGGPGKNIRQFQTQLEEQHTESWLQKQILFLTDFRRLMQAVASGLKTPIMLGDLPTMLPVPKHRWLMQAYSQDLLCRLEETKASITSQFGRILKMDSAKRIVKKLAGESNATSSWVTNIINEHGQVIMSVLTASEGRGLEKMMGGVVSRYQDGGVPPPEVLYVQQDCCGSTHVRNMFRPWHSTEIRLDVWQFMQRIAAGCTSDSHAFYAEFMNRLGHCVFIWDQRDIQALREAKRAELEDQQQTRPSDADVTRHISRAEMALHCRRSTRGSSEMEERITALIQACDGETGCHPLGVPLINSVRMAEIWEAQKRHLPCIQDPPGVQLYTQTGTLRKGPRSLPTYRCARDTTSLQRFHHHINSFIPGTVASAALFQAYLVEGIGRWNEDRAVAAEGRVVSHSGRLRDAANRLAREVMGITPTDSTGSPNYTGELIGVEYLYDQTGSALEDYQLTVSALETEEVTVAEDEGFVEHVEQVKLEDVTISMPEESDPPPSPATSSRATSTSAVCLSSPPTSTTTAIASTHSALVIRSSSLPASATKDMTSTSSVLAVQSSALLPSTATAVTSTKKAKLRLTTEPAAAPTWRPLAGAGAGVGAGAGTPQSCPISVLSSAGPRSLPAVPVLILPRLGPEDPTNQLAPSRLLLPPGVTLVAVGSSRGVSGQYPHSASVPYSTQRYRKRKWERGTHTRKYVKRRDVVICKQCQKERKPSTHVQYFGNWYCEETSTVKLSEWRKNLAARGYGKKKESK
ncbi:uncharacterized protein LOC134089490 [Sardina pilchardus]|uniref:uncharacterized protein LOC134089490 n=1 Tax=Sardina pilchardus TaxID=27697 RepID=UPI002E0F0D29